MKLLTVIIFVLSLGFQQPLLAQDSLTNVPGTHVMIKLPDGFVWSRTASGFLKDSSAYISVNEFPYDNYYTGSTELRSQLSAWPPSAVKLNRSMKVGIYDATLVQIEGEKDEHFFLSFGDSSFSTLITARIEKDRTTEAQILTVLSSVTYDRGLKVNPLIDAGFYLDPSYKELVLLNHSGSDYVFGKATNPSIEDFSSRIIVTRLPSESVKKPADISAVFSDGVRSLQILHPKTIIRQSQISDSVAGIESAISGSLGDKPVLVLQKFIQTPSAVLIVRQVSDLSDADAYRRFRNLVNSLRFTQ